MKIALVREKVHRYGGAEKNVVFLAEGLLKAGHEVHIFAAAWDDPVAGAVYHRVLSKTFLPFLKPLVFARRVAAALAKERPCLVFSFERIFSPDVYRAGDGCHIEWMRRLGGERGLIGKILIWLSPKHHVILYLERRLFADPKLRHVVTNSRMVKDEIIRNYGVPENRITVIYNGVEKVPGPASPETKAALRRELGFAPDDYLVLFVGSNFERKGLRYLIEAVKAVPQAKVIVVGKGDERAYRKIAQRNGVAGRVFFFGARKDVDRFYAAADIFVLPTLYDPFSNVTLEAMSHGLPVITTPDNGAAEVVQGGQEGVISHRLDIGAGLKTLSDRDVNEQMAKRAVVKATQFGSRSVIEKTLALFSVADS
ncbi:MAG TPA: glycosyltransferase family 4 protein [bacterium]|nr:glycosyltransferase family 4 protein [bacterium]